MRGRGWILLATLPLGGCGPSEAPRGETMEREAPSPVVAPGDRPPALQIGHARGAAAAPVEVVEFSDFGCVSCAEFARSTYPELEREFVESGLVRWRMVPIRQGFYNGGEAAEAAECAAAQDRFWEMHDALAQGRSEWQPQRDPLPVFTGYAAAMGLDTAAFRACYREGGGEPALRTHDLVALSLGIRGVPVFLVGGQRVIGALETQRFRAILRDALERRPEAAE